MVYTTNQHVQLMHALINNKSRSTGLKEEVKKVRKWKMHVPTDYTS